MTSLSSVATLRSGHPFRSADWLDRGVPVIKIANIKGGRVIQDGCGYVSEEIASSASQWMTRDGDLLLAMTGYVGEVALIRPGERFLINQRVGRFEFRGDSPIRSEFLFYYLQVPEVRAAVEEMARGSAQPNLSARDASNLVIPVPPKHIQDTIIEIGGVIDDRIDNLRETNATLEAIAQAVFKSWFVDFDPVRAKADGREPEGMDAATAALFPSEFEDSELGPIPNGWRRISFGDVAMLSKGSVNPMATPAREFRHYSLPAFDTGQLPLIEQGESIKSNKTPVPSDAVLVSKLNPHIPRIWFVGHVGKDAVCSTEFLVWTPKPGVGSAFVYVLAASPEFNSEMRQLVTGTSNSHQRVRPGQLAEVQAAVISDEALAGFEAIVGPMLQQVDRNRRLAATLAETRDTLLPRLISGRLRFSEIKASIDDLSA